MMYKHTEPMSRTIQLRNVPDALHRILKSRAAQAGMSLSDYVLSEIREVSALPTLTELQQRMQRREPVNLPEPAAAAVRAERAARDRP
jgi:plasmid stability protein